MKEIEQLYQTYKFTEDPKILVLILKKIFDVMNEKKFFSSDYEELKKILELKDSCEIEFTRQDQRILCTNDYELKIINEKLVKDYIKIIKELQ